MSKRFRPAYRTLSPEEVALIDAIKTKATELEALVNSGTTGRHASLALTALEESVMWAVKQVTA